MAGRTKRAATKAKIVQERAPGFQGWNTSDAEEIERRRWRGLTDIAVIDSLEPGERYFGAYRVRSTTGGSYEVEIRSLTERENSCGCADWRVKARRSRDRERAAEWPGLAERKLRMASLLADGSFAEEALAPIGEAASLAIRSLAFIVGGAEIDAIPDLGERESVRPHLPPGSIAFLAALGTGDALPDLDLGRAAGRDCLPPRPPCWTGTIRDRRHRPVPDRRCDPQPITPPRHDRHGRMAHGLRGRRSSRSIAACPISLGIRELGGTSSEPFPWSTRSATAPISASSCRRPTRWSSRKATSCGRTASPTMWAAFPSSSAS